MMTTRAIATACLLLVAACGGGGGAAPGGPPSGDLEISTLALDQGNVGHAFFQQLTATGGAQPYTWWVSFAGDPLPDGLAVTSDGRLAGVPTEAAVRTVLVVVQDVDSVLDVLSMPIEVRDVEITPGATGNLPPGSAVFFSAAGGVANYDFALTANQSGGTITVSGDYQAGTSQGLDVVRATDQDGFYEEVAVSIGSDPFVGFVERYGLTDVWWINWDVVYDPSPVYASDLDEVLVALGLRNPSSTGAQGQEEDDLARQLVIRRALAHCSVSFGNGADGNPLPGGLAISLVGPSGPALGITPGIGGVIGAGPFRYSSICLRWGPSPTTVGTAWIDSGNVAIEHNCGDPGGTALGVFSNRILAPYLAAYNNSIASNRINAGDIDGLRAMLMGSAPSNSREQAIYDVADGYARTAAAVIAHEIGHSLGLLHPNPSTGPGDLMNATLQLGPSVAYAFSPGDWATLLTALPGPNR